MNNDAETWPILRNKHIFVYPPGNDPMYKRILNERRCTNKFETQVSF